MRSARAFDVTADDGAAIRRALDTLSSDDAPRFPRIEGLQRKRSDDILGTIHVSKYRDGVAEHLVCMFKFLVGRRTLYMAGRQDARDLALDELDKLGDLEGVVSLKPLSNEHIAHGILSRLREQHKRNFIRRMSIEFGVAGIDYHNSAPLYRLDYQLIQDSCASTRRSFGEFVKGARQVRARFGIVRHFSMDRTGKGDKPASLNVGPDSSMSMYVDMEAEAWYDILDYLLEEEVGE